MALHSPATCCLAHPGFADEEGSLALQRVTSYYHQPLDHALITQKANGTALAVSFPCGLRMHEQLRQCSRDWGNPRWGLIAVSFWVMWWCEARIEARTIIRTTLGSRPFGIAVAAKPPPTPCTTNEITSGNDRLYESLFSPNAYILTHVRKRIVSKISPIRKPRTSDGVSWLTPVLAESAVACSEALDDWPENNEVSGE